MVGAFNLFTFKVIIGKYGPVAIYFVVLGSSLYKKGAQFDSPAVNLSVWGSWSRATLLLLRPEIGRAVEEERVAEIRTQDDFSLPLVASGMLFHWFHLMTELPFH